MELYLHSPVLVGVNLLSCRSDDNRRLRPRHYRTRAARLRPVRERRGLQHETVVPPPLIAGEPFARALCPNDEVRVVMIRTFNANDRARPRGHDSALERPTLTPLQKQLVTHERGPHDGVVTVGGVGVAMKRDRVGVVVHLGDRVNPRLRHVRRTNRHSGVRPVVVGDSHRCRPDFLDMAHTKDVLAYLASLSSMTIEVRNATSIILPGEPQIARRVAQQQRFFVVTLVV